jgi:hypothetical protein
MSFQRYSLVLLTLAAVGALPARASGADDAVVAVLSSNSGPYQQAFQGFQQAFGSAIPSYTLSEGKPTIPSRARVIVAFGGKAALAHYPMHGTLIYCLAPGTKIGPEEHDGPLVKVHTSPAVLLTVQKFKELQPALKRLAVLWAGESIKDYFEHKKDVAGRLGVDLVSDRVTDPDELPNHLRTLKGTVDAIWLPPDAAMVTPKNFATIKEFSLANGIPFYVPSEGLVEQGATASLSASFGEIGALAARMAHQAQDGPPNVDNVFPEKSHLAVNLTAARACNLKISPDILKQADKVVP